jgi:hypothetical protein
MVAAGALGIAGCCRIVNHLGRLPRGEGGEAPWSLDVFPLEYFILFRFFESRVR